MCGCITSFMVSMNSQVKTHKVFEVIALDSQHMGKVTGPVQRNIRCYMVAIVIGTAVDIGCYPRKAGDEVQGILEDARKRLR